MFDVGFWELCLVALVALIVLGPERMLHAAKVSGRLIGRLKRSLADIQQELERQ